MSTCREDHYGNKKWYNDHGLFHREDGPAAEYKDGTKYWMINDLFHRYDGPAVEYSDGRKYWYYEGKHIECDSQEEFIKLIKLKAFW